MVRERSLYSKAFKDLEMYQKLIQYCSIVFDVQSKAKPLDNMNFDMDVFPPAIRLSDIERIFDFEPGYTSNESNHLGPLIRHLELTRLNDVSPQTKQRNKDLVEKAGVGAGHGCTNVLSGVLNSITRLPKEKFPRQNGQREIILPLPCYPVYFAQIATMWSSARAKFIRAKRENDFLPTFEQIKKAVTRKTIAIIIIYPTNPTQSTYEGRSIEELRKIISFSQSEGIFLIADNVYQDLLYPRSRKHVEPFTLTDKLDYVIKVFGPSKDTAFFSGYRCGYWFGDTRILSSYADYVYATENTLSTVSMLLFALEMLFRSKRLSKEKLTLSDIKLLDTGLIGWGRLFNAKQIYQRLNESRLFEKYNERVDRAYALMRQANEKVRAFVENSKFFSDYVNQKIGNVFFIKVNPKYFSGDDDDFFHLLMRNGKYGVLPGSVFGMPERDRAVWFRITLVHDSCDNILKGLQSIEKILEKASKRSR